MVVVHSDLISSPGNDSFLEDSNFTPDVS